VDNPFPPRGLDETTEIDPIVLEAHARTDAAWLIVADLTAQAGAAKERLAAMIKDKDAPPNTATSSARWAGEQALRNSQALPPQENYRGRHVVGRHIRRRSI
jgi:hypothetical protein